MLYSMWFCFSWFEASNEKKSCNRVSKSIVLHEDIAKDETTTDMFSSLALFLTNFGFSFLDWIFKLSRRMLDCSATQTVIKQPKSAFLYLGKLLKQQSCLFWPVEAIRLQNYWFWPFEGTLHYRAINETKKLANKIGKRSRWQVPKT